MADRSNEFDDNPGTPATPGNVNPPPYPEQPGPNQPLRSPDFDDRATVPILQPPLLNAGEVRIEEDNLFRTISFLGENNCAQSYKFLRSTSKSQLYLASISIPDSNALCQSNNQFLTAEVSPDMDSIRISPSSSPYMFIIMRGLTTNQWILESQDRTEIIDLSAFLGNKNIEPPIVTGKQIGRASCRERV